MKTTPKILMNFIFSSSINIDVNLAILFKTEHQRGVLKGNTHHITSFERRENQFAANFIKIYQEIKKLYTFEVSLISFMEATIFMCL